ncbi:hypothetical protein MTR_3g463480 [Medicago truncatula]|uniref:Uncharacterized protein n=1 Tax=Medicago truncatula TaxID=3880 RepID=A0A072UWM1_MEDTR|nr:hypothetical protein MTR_3g463480 [Medicago truncatula]
MVSELYQDSLGHMLSSYRYRTTHHLCPGTNPNNDGLVTIVDDGVVKEIDSVVDNGFMLDQVFSFVTVVNEIDSVVDDGLMMR